MRKYGNINAQISLLSVVTQMQVSDESCNELDTYAEPNIGQVGGEKVNVSILMWKLGLLISTNTLADVLISSFSYWLAQVTSYAAECPL